MAKSVEQLITEANVRLRAGRIGVTIRQKSNRLYLRATLPPKPDSSKTEWHQQDLAIRMDGSPSVMANPSGVRYAEAKAKEIGGLIATRTFSWNPYLQRKVVPESSNVIATGTVKDQIERFREYYFSDRQRNSKTSATWKSHYLYILNKLPQDSPVTEDVLMCLFRSVIPGVTPISPDTNTRKRAVGVITAFAKFLGVEVDIRKYQGNYSSLKPIDPRCIPSDEDIARWRNVFPVDVKAKTGAKAYQYVYSVLATYGLRPYEFFYIDWETIKKSPGVITVRNSKSGNEREVYPCYPEWWEEWNLSKPILPRVAVAPGITESSNLSSPIQDQFRQYNIPFNPYDLRHAWAIRTMKYGWPTSLSARQMDHSERIHDLIYLRWIKSEDYSRTFELLRNKVDGLKPPEL